MTHMLMSLVDDNEVHLEAQPRRLHRAAAEELGHSVTLRFEVFDDCDVDGVAKRRYGPTVAARIN